MPNTIKIVALEVDAEFAQLEYRIALTLNSVFRQTVSNAFRYSTEHAYRRFFCFVLRVLFDTSAEGKDISECDVTYRTL